MMNKCKWVTHWEQRNIQECGVETGSDDRYCPEHRALIKLRISMPPQGEGVWVSKEDAEVLKSCHFRIMEDDRPYEVRRSEQMAKYETVKLLLAQLSLPESAAEEIVHRCPREGESLTPCCWKTPFELLRTDRITLDDSLVTCKTPSATTGIQEGVQQTCHYIRMEFEKHKVGCALYESPVKPTQLASFPIDLETADSAQSIVDSLETAISRLPESDHLDPVRSDFSWLIKQIKPAIERLQPLAIFDPLMHKVVDKESIIIEPACTSGFILQQFAGMLDRTGMPTTAAQIRHLATSQISPTPPDSVTIKGVSEERLLRLFNLAVLHVPLDKYEDDWNLLGSLAKNLNDKLIAERDAQLNSIMDEPKEPANGSVVHLFRKWGIAWSDGEPDGGLNWKCSYDNDFHTWKEILAIDPNPEIIYAPRRIEVER